MWGVSPRRAGRCPGGLPGARGPPPPPDPRPLLASVAAQARRRPQAVALRDGCTTVTYGELWRRVEALAAHLQAKRPDGAGPYVAVAVSRGVRLPETLLAVLHAGLAYLPLDPEAPAPRLAEMAARAGARLAVVDGPADWAGPDMAVLSPDDAPQAGSPAPHAAGDAAPAYVIFTSGSTGEPKGVEIPRGALDNFLSSMAAVPGLTRADRLLAVTTVAFDIAALELFLPLTVGAEVFVAGRDEVRDGFRLAARLNAGGATVMQATPTLWQMLLEAGFRPRADLTMLAGGEPLPADLAERLMAGGGALWNMYGPTETTIWSSCGRLAPGGAVTLGRPVRATELHVLDPEGALCPPGVPGELNIGGAGLATGYLGRPELTSGAFREVTLGGRPRRLYRSGDRAVRGVDGALRLLGRLDRQIKLRGYRIEPGEIEARLRALPEIAQAAVELRGPGGSPLLTGYVVPREGEGPDPAHLAAALRADLPDYMIPGRWVVLPALPLTANGKLDRRALPDPGPDAAPAAPAAPASAPAGPIEARLAAIAAEVMGLAEIPPDVGLLALGADSLTLFRLAARLLAEGIAIEVRDILARPTIRALAALADSRGASGAGASPGGRPSLSEFRHGARRDTG
ncbi:MAG: non-ribosomal peptide synthetase [Tranquillimonas sp.]